MQVTNYCKMVSTQLTEYSKEYYNVSLYNFKETKYCTCTRVHVHNFFIIKGVLDYWHQWQFHTRHLQVLSQRDHRDKAIIKLTSQY